MKKKIIAICLCLALAAIAVVGASLAYFTDTKSATNTFTVGNVKIELIESTYHRTGNDNAGDTSVPDPAHKASGMEYVTDNWDVFTDEEIQADAEKYDDYIGKRGENLVPGRNVVKCPYVINTGANDAYVRIRVMIPSAANGDFINVEKGGVITNQWCGTALQGAKDKNPEFQHGSSGAAWPVVEKAGYTDDNGVTYDVYTFTRIAPLKAGKMTEWNVWNYIGLDKNANEAAIQKAIDAKAITVKDGKMTFNVLVQADAIQAEGFADATAAFAAFDK